MIGFARRHPAITTLGLGVFVVIAGGIYRSALGGVLILLWVGLLIFFTVRWLRRRFAPKAPPVETGVLQQAPVPSWPYPLPREPFVAPSLGDVLTLTATQFEKLCRDVLAVGCGFQGLKLVGGPGDLGADIIGRDCRDRKVIVQCKRYAPGNQVGSPVLQSFIGMMTVQHKAERGVFITSASFSLPAVNLAKAHGVTLIDGPMLLTLMALTGIGAATQSMMLPTPSVMVPTKVPGGTYQLTGWNHTPSSIQDALTSLASPNGSSQVNVAPRAPKFCTSCGEPAGDGVAYCANCGQKVKRG